MKNTLNMLVVVAFKPIKQQNSYENGFVLQGLGRFGVKTDKMFQTVIGNGRLGRCIITLHWQYILGSIVKNLPPGSLT